MKKLIPPIMIFVVTLAFAACGKKAEEHCSYSYQPEATRLTWTAYKFIKKAGVSGSFDKIQAKGTEKADSAGAVFAKMEFQIPVDTVNSRNPGRDKKIAASFFGTMTDTSSISGKVVSIDSANEGKARIRIRLNGKEKELPFTFTTSDAGEFTAQASMNLADWDALLAVEALNKVCSEKHSQDGKSKLWPDVDLKITTKLEKSCN